DDAIAAIQNARLLHDGDTQVRLATLLALAEMPASKSAADEVLAALTDERTLQDQWLMDAATSAAAAQAMDFLAKALHREWKEPVHGNVLTVVERIAEHYARGGPVETAGTLLADLSAGRPAVSSAVISGVNRGWPKDKTPAVDDATEKALVALFPKLSPRARGQL